MTLTVSESRSDIVGPMEARAMQNAEYTMLSFSHFPGSCRRSRSLAESSNSGKESTEGIVITVRRCSGSLATTERLSFGGKKLSN